MTAKQILFNVVPPMPAWTSLIVDGRWSAISNNTIADVNPANESELNPNYPGVAPWRATSDQAGVISAWNGGWLLPGLGVFGTYGVGPCGGHEDYWGSESYAFDLQTALWRLLSPPSVGPYNWPNSSGIWPGNIPGAVHTYQQLAADTFRNEVFVAKMQTLNSPSTSIPRPAMLNPNTGQWRFGTQYSGSGAPTNSQGWMCEDTLRHGFWIRGGNTGAAFTFYNPDPSTGGWTQYSGQSSESDSMAGYDPVNDAIIVCQVAGGQLLYGINPASPNTARVQLTQANRPSLSVAMGFAYSPARQAFLVWNTGGTVWECKKGPGTWQSAIWAWMSLTDVGNAVQPQRTLRGTYSRFAVASYSGGDYGIVVNAVNEPVYAFGVPQVA